MEHTWFSRTGRPRWKLTTLRGAWAAVAILISFLLDDNFGVATLRGILFGEFHMYCLEEGLLFTCGKIAPESKWNSRDHQWSYANPRQPVNDYVRCIHHPADDVIHPFMKRNREEYPIAGFAEDAEFIWRYPASIDLHSTANALERFGGGHGRGENVIFLFESKFRMHHAVGEFAVIREQQQTFGVAIEPTDRIETLRSLHKFHHGLAIAIVAGGGNEPAWFVEHDVAAALRTHHFTIDANFVVGGIGFGAKLRNGVAVYGNAARDDQLLGNSA
ncbi:hypothetical protein BH09CHL1_BH09CHL1_09660 [soil metagenome]